MTFGIDISIALRWSVLVLGKRISSCNTVLHFSTSAGFHIAFQLKQTKTKVIFQLFLQFIPMTFKVLHPVFPSDPVLMTPFQRVFQEMFDSRVLYSMK